MPQLQFPARVPDTVLAVCHASRRERPHLPVIAESLEFSVAADEDLATVLDDLGVFGGEAREDMFVFAEPSFAAASLGIEQVVRHEVARFHVVVNFGVFEEVVFGERASVGDDQRGRVVDAGLGEEFDRVFVDRCDGKAVLVTAEAVDGVREVQFEVESAFGGGHGVRSCGACGEEYCRIV